MLNYEKLYNKFKSTSSGVGTEESIIDTKGDNTIPRRHFDVNELFPLEALKLVDRKNFLGMEDDNPFSDIGDEFDDSDTTDSGVFEDDSDNSNDNPFDSIGDDDPFGDSDDPFSTDSDGDKKKNPTPTLNREEATKEKFNLSKIIRRDFPDYIYKLQGIISSAINILEKKQVKPELSKLKEDLVIRYRETLHMVETYLTEIDGEKYEDIFTTYVNFWTILNKLKITSQKILHS
ncbi:MAG: hypothetical protein ACRCX2_36370 [Paraclostridium sp.]